MKVKLRQELQKLRIKYLKAKLEVYITSKDNFEITLSKEELEELRRQENLEELKEEIKQNNKEPTYRPTEEYEKRKIEYLMFKLKVNIQEKDQITDMDDIAYFTISELEELTKYYESNNASGYYFFNTRNIATNEIINTLHLYKLNEKEHLGVITYPVSNSKREGIIAVWPSTNFRRTIEGMLQEGSEVQGHNPRNSNRRDMDYWPLVKKPGIYISFAGGSKEYMQEEVTCKILEDFATYKPVMSDEEIER